MKTRIVLLVMGLFALATSQASAEILETKQTCTGKVPTTYFCVSMYGYKGKDPYGLNRHSQPNEIDGTMHGCTSFAAYMLSLNNPWISGLSGFDAARSWAHDALTKTTGAVVDNDPTAGDIAQWGKPSDTSLGHVAYVEQVHLDGNGAVIGIVVADDNGGTYRWTTRKTIMKSSPTEGIRWPDNFITFPGYPSDGGGKFGWLMTSIQVTP